MPHLQSNSNVPNQQDNVISNSNVEEDPFSLNHITHSQYIGTENVPNQQTNVPNANQMQTLMDQIAKLNENLAQMNLGNIDIPPITQVNQNKSDSFEMLDQSMNPISQSWQIEGFSANNAMSGLGIQEPNVEPNLAQELEAKLKLRGEIKGDIRMFKFGKKMTLPDDKIKDLFIKKNKFEDVKQHFAEHSERLEIENGYESEDIELMGE